MVMKIRHYLTYLISCLSFLCLLPGNADAQRFSVFGPDSRIPHNQFPLEKRFMWTPPVTKGGPVQSHKALVILAQFNDVYLSYTMDKFNNMLNQYGYKESDARDCAAKYLEDQFGYRFQIDLAGVVTVSKEQKYYGGNDPKTKRDSHVGTFIAEACTLADQQLEVDFSSYDEDGDGFVDHVFVFYAGEDEAQQSVNPNTGKRENEDLIWAHTARLKDTDYGSSLEFDGVKVDLYACASELYRLPSGMDTMAPIGTFCHEFCHCLGLVDLYDTDYELSGGIAAGTWGKTSLMDTGNYNMNGTTPPNLNAIELEILGIRMPEDLSVGNYNLLPLGTQGSKTYRILNPNDSTEYYLFECRDSTGWDSGIHGAGLLVYHIDKSPDIMMNSEVHGKSISSKERWEMYNEVNCCPGALVSGTGKVEQTKEKHQCADLVEADGRSDLNPTKQSLANIKGVFFPQVGVVAIGGEAAVKMPFWDGTFPNLAISNITCNGGSVSFKVTDVNSPLPPVPVDPPKDEDPLYIVVQYDAPLDHGLVPKGTTLTMYVSNTVGAKEEKWFFNNRAIGDPAAFKAESSGEIRAEIYRNDGNVDYVFKSIKVNQ